MTISNNYKTINIHDKSNFVRAESVKGYYRINTRVNLKNNKKTNTDISLGVLESIIAARKV